MIFNLVMKTPDAIDSTLDNLEGPYCGLAEIDKAKEMMSSILEYGEYLTVQCDTNNGTFTVLKKHKTYWN